MPDMPADHFEITQMVQLLSCSGVAPMCMPDVHSCAEQADYASFLHHIQPSPQSTSPVISNVAAIIFWLCENPANKLLQRRYLIFVKWTCSLTSRISWCGLIFYGITIMHLRAARLILDTHIFFVQRTHAAASTCCTNQTVLPCTLTLCLVSAQHWKKEYSRGNLTLQLFSRLSVLCFILLGDDSKHNMCFVKQALCKSFIF